MRNGESSGKVVTVLGPIAPEELGITLPHEHILTDARMYFIEPKTMSDRKRAYEPITLGKPELGSPQHLPQLRQPVS